MSELNRTQLTAENQASFPNNNTGFITPTLLRTFNQDVVDSMAFQSQVSAIQTDLDALVLSGSGVVVQEDGVSLGPVTDLNFSGSAVNVTVSGSVATIDISPSLILDAYLTTASFNAYTSSQNSFNAAATASIVALQNFSSSLDATYATDAQLNASSSTLQANINTKLNTSSFNSFTQSYNTFSSSVASEINSLQDVTGSYVTTSSFNSFSSSVASEINSLQDVTGSYATTSSLNSLSSSLSTRLTTDEGNISSNTNRIQSLESKTGSYATTGSNTFTGNQLFNGSLNVTGDITASKLLVQIETASVIYSSGSNQFGDAANDVQTLYGSVRVMNNLTASGLNYPTADGTADQVLITDGAGNLSFTTNAVAAISEDVRYGETIAVGDPLYVSGSSGNRPIVFKADAADANKMPVIYVASLAGGVNTNTKALTLGLITGVTTTGYPAGTDIYVAEGGGWSDSRPSGSASIVQSLGIVTKEGSGGSGRGLILNPGPATLPNIQEGYAWVGNSNSYPVAVATSSFSAGIDISVLATTGSNFFTGNQTIDNGQKLITDTIEVGNPSGLTIQGNGAAIFVGDSTFVSPVVIQSDAPSINTNGNKLSITGSISLTDKIESTGKIILQPDAADPRYLNVYNTAAQDTHITASGGYLYLGDDTTYVMVDNYGSGRKVYITADNGLAISGSTIVTGSVDITGDYKVNGVPLSTSSIDTSSFATTGSNTFEGNQTINGDIIVTGSVETDRIYTLNVSPLDIDAAGGVRLQLQGSQMEVSGSIQSNGAITSLSGFSGDGANVTNVDAVTLDGLDSTDFAKTGSANTFYAAQTVSNGVGNNTNVTPIAVSNVDSSGGMGQTKNITISANPSSLGGPLAAWTQPTIYGIGNAGPYQIIEFQSQGNYTDGRTSFKTPMVVTGSFTASLQEGYAWVGGAGGVSTAVATSSFAGGGSGVGFPFTGSAQITGSLGVTGSILVQSGSFSASVVSNLGDIYTDIPAATKIVTLTSASYAALSPKDPNTLYVISGSVVSGGSGVGFPFTGSAQITGSLAVTGSISVLSGSLSGSVITNLGDIYTTTPSTQTIVTLTQAEYDAIGTKNPNTLYVVSGSAATTLFPYTGSAQITGSLVITGSAEMNVVNLSIVSNTASIDLNAGNYFSGSLSGSVFFNITNVRPGETAIVKLSTTGIPTASFSSNVRQISGSAYVATSGSGQTDILTLVSMDTTNVFLLNSKKFI